MIGKVDSAEAGEMARAHHRLRLFVSARASGLGFGK